jgi:hypothetical protein
MKKSGKNKGIVARLFGSLLVLFFGVVLLGGCSWAHPGETAAEVHRRHVRTVRINNEQLLADIDKVLLIDEPSKLSEYRLP